MVENTENVNKFETAKEKLETMNKEHLLMIPISKAVIMAALSDQVNYKEELKNLRRRHEAEHYVNRRIEEFFGLFKASADDVEFYQNLIESRDKDKLFELIRDIADNMGKERWSENACRVDICADKEMDMRLLAIYAMCIHSIVENEWQEIMREDKRRADERRAGEEENK